MKNENSYLAIAIGAGVIFLWLSSKYGPDAVKAAALATLKQNASASLADAQVTTPALGTTLVSPDSTPYMLTNTDLTVDPTTGLDVSSGGMPVEPLPVVPALLDNGVSGGF